MSHAVAQALEERKLLSAPSWSGLSTSGSAPPDGGEMMNLLSNGTVLIQDGLNASQGSPNVYTLTPQANTGSYINGAFAETGSMGEDRLFSSSAVLPDGRVMVIGGEYPKFSNTVEIYNPATGVWTYQDPAPTPPTNIDLSGKITGASNSSPIVISTSVDTFALQNGAQVFISGVGGNTAANGTFTVSSVSSSGFTLNGSSGNGSYTSGGTWNSFTPQFGDDPIEVLPPSPGHPDGQVFCGYYNNTQTFLFDPDAPSGSQWTSGPNKLDNDRSDEESWVKLPDGSILSYDDFASQGSTFQAQRYVPSMNKWVEASNLDPTNPPTVLTDPTVGSTGEGSELGPSFLLPNGNVVVFGANGNTAYYDPTTDLWSAGPLEPVVSGTPMVGTDDPGAMLPNGDVLIALSPLGGINSNGAYTFPGGTNVYEFNPTSGFTNVSPGGGSGDIASGGSSIGDNAYATNMVLLPTGQVLMSDESNSFQVFTEDPSTGPQNAWRPTITSFVENADGSFTLTGTQLAGISEGGDYGDDLGLASNYPLVQFTDGGGNIFYATSSNWSTTDVDTGSTAETVQFTLPSGKDLTDFTSMEVITNGIPSVSIPADATPNVMAPTDQTAVEGAVQTINLGSFIDPTGSPWTVDVNWGDGSSDTTFSTSTSGSLGTATHTYGEEGNYTPKVTVTDDTGLAGSAKFHVAVSDPAVIPTGAFTVTDVEGADSGIQTVATFMDPGGAEPNSFAPGAINTHYQASIDWGDGSLPSSGTITYAGAPDSTSGVFTIQGDHTYGEEGTYTITVTIDHETAAPASVSSTAVVSDPPVVATGTSITAISCIPLTGVSIATFTDPGGAEPNPSDPSGTINNHYSVASINWGDGTPLDTTTGTLSYGGSPGSMTAPFTISGSHTYTSEGTYSVTVVIDHESSAPTTVTSTVTVKDNIGLLTLDPTHPASLNVTGNGSVDVNNCGAVVVNSNSPYAAVITGNGGVSAMDIDVTGGTIRTGHGTFSSPIDHEPPNADPIGLPLPAAPATTFPAVYYSGKATLTLSPGTYVGGIHDMGQGNIVLLPGVYYLQGGGLQVTGNGSLSGAGVLIFNAPGFTFGNICFTGQGNINLTAPAPGSLPSVYALYQGITIFQDPASPLPILLTGNGSVTMDGALYAPGAQLMITGNGGLTDSTDTNAPIAQVIVYDASVSGNGSLVINADALASNPPLNTPLPGAAKASFTSFTTSANPAVPNQPLTLTVTMASTPSSAGPPQGLVDFFDTTTHLDLGFVALSGGVASVTSSIQSLGGHAITATYFAGSPNFAPPAAPDSLAQQINSEVIEGGQLYVGGDPATESIHVASGKGQAEITVSDAGYFQTPVAGLSGLVVYGGAATDKIQVDNTLTLPAFLFGGSDYTQIQAGGGPTLEIGGSGGGNLHGGADPSILIAGTAQATLQAGSGGSILMGGYSDYDSNLPALQAALAEWGSSDSYGVRTTSPALSIFSAATVHSNGVNDVLQGVGGSTPLDWFFASTLDTIFNQNASELKLVIS